MHLKAVGNAVRVPQCRLRYFRGMMSTYVSIFFAPSTQEDRGKDEITD